jgi:glycosyltransferase involved in cell wall biosynthesis
VHLGLLDPLKSLHPAEDNLYYQAMAQNPFSSNPMVHTGPFCWRVLTPWLVHLLTRLGLSVQGSFLLVESRKGAYGLPSITTNTGGVPEVVKDGENGFVLPYDARGDA